MYTTMCTSEVKLQVFEVMGRGIRASASEVVGLRVIEVVRRIYQHQYKFEKESFMRWKEHC